MSIQGPRPHDESAAGDDTKPVTVPEQYAYPELPKWPEEDWAEAPLGPVFKG